MNMIVEVICGAEHCRRPCLRSADIVLTGKLTRIFRFMQRVKRLEFVFGRGFTIPEHADYATAIGAARIRACNTIDALGNPPGRTIGGSPMRVNKLRATLKSGGVALGTLVWETRGRGVVTHFPRPEWISSSFAPSTRPTTWKRWWTW